jgi:outer membrane protein OmpA-like peptidoglycan-associated protein
MRILTIGILAFFAWSTFSTYLYVCKIKRLCIESVTMQMSSDRAENAVSTDTMHKPIIVEKLAAPKDLIIYFAFDKSEFSSNSITEKYIEELIAYLNQNEKASLKITGHTDAIGTKDYNKKLGYRRAESVKRYFENESIAAKILSAESQGEMLPVDNNKTKEGRANNRRTVITIKR